MGRGAGDFPLDALPKPLSDLARAAAAAGNYPPEFVAERLGPRPEGEVQRRAVGFGPPRMVSEPEDLGSVFAVSGLSLPKPRLQDRPPVRVFGER
ncbi:MAG: hypothetical protein WBU92_00215 [Candidatus Dormiibacterota bacterium]